MGWHEAIRFHTASQADCNWAAMVGRVYDMTDIEFQAVYNATSFGLATMMATTMYLWFRMSAVKDRYKSAVCISGLVTFIAAYHYFRIFNSWVEAYSYSIDKDGHASGPQLTGVPFNDAYRYMDWLLTVPLLVRLHDVLPVHRSGAPR